ncbi:hypothetical protein [Psychrobacter sp. I-STPA10]|uniref:hypothetical protein n=1 Tax=Psychrobacter sp. I-STPA10 TaxID=2585769 RepID=UPI001E65180A|nr:hypothetical protein [Psychrobacter sp. I-STPA10]
MQKRMNDMQWSGKSNLPQITSVKQPKYYLTVINTEEQYEEDIYFVNNSDAVLPLVIADWLTDDDYQAINKLAFRPKTKHETEQENITSLAEAMNIKPELVYQQVQPYQGVKIATQHIIYSSDGLNQCRISVFANTSINVDDSVDSHAAATNAIANEVWKFSVVESGLFTGGALLWKDDSVPKSIIAMQVVV